MSAPRDGYGATDGSSRPRLTATRAFWLCVAWVGGFAAASSSASCILYLDERLVGLGLAMLSVFLFVAAAWMSAANSKAERFWAIVNAVGLGVLTALWTVALGAIAVSFVPWDSWW